MRKNKDDHDGAKSFYFFLAAGIPIGDGEFLIWEGEKDTCPFTPAQVVRIM